MLPVDHIQFRKHVLTVRPKVRKGLRNEEAGRVVMTLLHEWQRLRTSKVSRPQASNVVSGFGRLEDIRAFAGWLNNRSTLEGAFWLSSAYATLVSPEKRTNCAMFFTPPALAERVIDNLIVHGASLDRHVWHDPAGGGGAFLAPLADRMIKHALAKGMSRAKIAQNVLNRITANELDPFLSNLASHFVLMIFSDHQIQTKPLQPKIVTTDSLCEVGNLLYDVVVCNPPYRKLKAEELERYRENFGEVMTGQSNLYGLFMKRCIELCRPGGLIGLLTPTSYQSGLHFAKLRNYLLEQARLLQIDIIHDRLGVFIDVEQDASATVFKKRKIAARGSEEIAINRLENAEVQFVGTAILKPDAPTWLLPKHADDVSLIADARRCLTTILDYGYSVRVGGYVAYRDERKTTTRLPASKDNKALYFPLISAGDILTSGVLEHGRHVRVRGAPLYVRNNSLNPIQSVERPVIAIQRLTSSDQRRRLVTAVVPQELMKDWGGVIGENHVLFLVPAGKPFFSAQQMVGLLSSQVVDRIFRAMSGVANISSYELKNLPLPSPLTLLNLVAGNKKISESLVREAYAATAKY